MSLVQVLSQTAQTAPSPELGVALTRTLQRALPDGQPGFSSVLRNATESNEKHDLSPRLSTSAPDYAPPRLYAGYTCQPARGSACPRPHCRASGTRGDQ